MRCANLLRIGAERSAVTLSTRPGMVFMKMDKLVRHGANQCVGVPDRGLRNTDDVPTVLQQVPPEQGGIADHAEFHILAVGQIPRGEGFRLVQEVVAGAQGIGGHESTTVRM